MRIVDINDAETQLCALVELAAKGFPFVIARDGKPLVKVEAVEAPSERKIQRLGFMNGLMEVPDDFDSMGREEIERMFYGDDE